MECVRAAPPYPSVKAGSRTDGRSGDGGSADVSVSTAWDEGPSVLASAWRYRWLLPVAVLLDGPATAVGAARNVANQAAFMASTPVLQQASRRYGNGMTPV